MRDPHGKIIQYYGLSIDIDERKRAEDRLRDTHIELAKASRLTTVAELSGSIAHELNQPLMSILANAQAAKRWLNAAPPNVTEVNASIERTIRDARAADETMQHIRALFKQESFVKKDVKIPDILNEVIRIVQEDPKKRAVPVECHLEESLPAIPADQIQIQQVFINLIVNAIEALEGQQGPPQVTLRAAVTDSDRILIQVIDNGPGVHDPERIFDAFMTTKEKGMGIGLAVSRSIVEAHGGRLWAENNKTGGAIFNVALPLSHAGEITLHFKLSHVDSVKGECVMVNDGVVPGGSGAVISKVGALHVGVVRKPAGKVIDTLPQAVGGLGALLAACRYSVAIPSNGNLSSRNGNIQEKPMKELNTRKRSGTSQPSWFTSSGRLGTSTSWQMRTKDLAGFWDVLLLELGIAVLAECEVVDPINPSEGKLGGYWTPVLKALTA